MASFFSGIAQGYAGNAKGDDNKKRTGLIKKALDKYKTSKQSSQGKNIVDSPVDTAIPVTAKRGAKRVKKTGWMKVHRNESVLTAKQAKRYRKARGYKSSGRKSR